MTSEEFKLEENIRAIPLSESKPNQELPLKTIGIAADHAGFELKKYIKKMLIDTGYEVIDFGPEILMPGDDYPDFVIPLAQAVATKRVERGLAICGSGVGACVAANKVFGVRAALISDTFSARQGVEDDDMNIICLGGRVVGPALAWELVSTFLEARFTAADRHLRRLAKVSKLENRGSESNGT
jgi:ribose 5-phosphate isomerase B